jgi:hypothetical protein
MLEDRYKLHQIFILATRNNDTHDWKVSLYIAEPNLRLYKYCALKKTFATEAAAISRAQEVAHKWIDDGKPEPFPEE